MDKSDLNKQIEELDAEKSACENVLGLAPDNVDYYGPKFVVRDKEYPEDSYSIAVVDGEVIAIPDNKSAHRRDELRKILETYGDI